MERSYFMTRTSQPLPVAKNVCELSDAQLDELEFGVSRLDWAGTILFINRAELTLTNRCSADTVGLNYFSDVAPCAAVKEFQGRFVDFVAAPDERSLTFGFFFAFGWDHKEVKITLLKPTSDDAHVYVATEIAAVSDDEGYRS